MILRQYIPQKLKSIADIIWEQRSDTPSRGKILPSGKVELLNRIEDKLNSDEPFIRKARWLEELICSKVNETSDLYLAHFIRSFKEFAGMTPGMYRNQKTHIPGQLPI